MKRFVPVGIVIGLAVGGCASGKATMGPEKVDPSLPCDVRFDEETEGEWRLVETDYFNFCVPGNWAQLDDRKWGQSGTWIEWHRGSPPQQEQSESRVVTIQAPREARPQDVKEALQGPPRAGGSTDLTEIIGGRRAQLWRRLSRSRHITGAEWRSPALSFTGETPASIEAAVMLEVYRSVRFLEQP